MPTSEYKSRTSPLPSGCSRVVSRMTNERENGSIHKLVPVNPVWPNEPSGNCARALSCHPDASRADGCIWTRCPSRARAAPAPSAASARWSSASRSRLSRCARRRVRRHSGSCGKTARDQLAQVKSPACPATPPMRRADGIMHDAAQHHAILVLLRRRDARQPLGRRLERRGGHLQRAEHMLRRKDIERLAARPAARSRRAG